MTYRPRTLTAAEEMRLCVGFVVQPFVAGLVAFVSFPFLLLSGTESGFYPDPTGAAISVGLGTFMLAIGITIVLVVPTAIWVLKRRALTFMGALLVGLAIGNLPGAAGGALSGIQRVIEPATRPANPWAAVGVVVFGSLIGVIGAAAFWAISIRGRDFSRDPD